MSAWRVFGLHEKADDLTQRIADWTATAEKIAQRAPAFSLTEQLLEQAAGLDGMDAQATWNTLPPAKSEPGRSAPRPHLVQVRPAY
jgi:hypothetical protein